MLPVWLPNATIPSFSQSDCLLQCSMKSRPQGAHNALIPHPAPCQPTSPTLLPPSTPSAVAARVSVSAYSKWQRREPERATSAGRGTSPAAGPRRPPQRPSRLGGRGALGGVGDADDAGRQALLPPRQLPLAHGLVLGAARLELVGQRLLANAVRLLLVDGLHQHALVLVHVTLDLQVQLAVQVAVDLLGVAVLLEHAAQHAQAAQPQDLGGQAGLAGSAPLTCMWVPGMEGGVVK
ncbi:hypothetical protein F751_5714 [Auxenochlorella protothecoides]|uniref:Uncharacterized protein n=1 Tax=Auxenochlorella protothecoides TaxID=3075 RepID=A0A087SRY3_AUXPR|nr:hypothetical protein F751_5714 [Auxenochlorella protothecoides]KFM28487.1 hypothetical protein F751_5714 [Auxenochlorella protothecoides]